MNEKVFRMWHDFQLPPPGSYVPNATSVYAYQNHLIAKYKMTGETLHTDRTDTRMSLKSGEAIFAEILGMDGGGHSFLTDDRFAVMLYEHGTMLLEMTAPGNGYADPNMKYPISININWAGNAAFAAEVKDLIKIETTVMKQVGSVYAMVATAAGVQFNAIGHGGEKLLRDNYSNEVLANYDRIKDALQSRVPPGRINILSGPPGTGKTFLIRGLIEEVPGAKFAVVQASEVAHLANPGTLPALLNFRHGNTPIVFIIEDAEEVLATRDAGNNNGVSALLNMGDGVLGSLIDLRIVATTNSKVQDLDPAIRRPGRLSTICEVGPLDWTKAGEVFRRLTGEEFQGENETYTIAEVYQMATDRGWRGEVKPARKVGFSANGPIKPAVVSAVLDMLDSGDVELIAEDEDATDARVGSDTIRKIAEADDKISKIIATRENE